jgi:hypothetical protein
LIYISKDQGALRKKFSFDGFVEVPLLSEEWPILSIDTEQGAKTVLLDTGCSWSLWRDTESEKLTPVIINKLTFNSIDFGVHTFVSFPITEASKVDAVLGLDFLKKHTIFIDLKNKRALISAQKF